MKKLLYDRKHANRYFWRTYSGVEIDYIEESGEKLLAFEMKYNKTKVKIPKTWQQQYGNDFQIINKDNYLDFIL